VGQLKQRAEPTFRSDLQLMRTLMIPPHSGDTSRPSFWQDPTPLKKLRHMSICQILEVPEKLKKGVSHTQSLLCNWNCKNLDGKM